MLILGIESSCDETAAAVVSDKKEILSNVIYSQIVEHKSFGGVVPEIAARAHLEKIDVVVRKALSDANVGLSDLEAIAGTCGPGLIGGVIVGATFAKALAMSSGLPFIAVNHIEAHALCARLTNDMAFPYLLMLASGGHCQLCIVRGVDDFEVLGTTIDDSVGEAFDKVAKLLELGYPGGPIIEKTAQLGDASKFVLPHPMCVKNTMDFSFSGLKTAVKVAAEKCETERDKIDLCACFQKTVIEVLRYKITQAIKHCLKEKIKISCVVMSGGVAANQAICKSLESLCAEFYLPFIAPPIRLCTDNGAMIAWLGVEKCLSQKFDELNFAPRPRWPLN
ncbi:MAG: tRNA (adenosine(37)-N6)-threonylcarbamoyltransferase complex transferase subunit TsaD [Alphaproteobacteria bacterium]|nr:tRNA (adenosine(37)-N6)-threonylcarbamoyltransferase complex transferase subunit TsaD [Alphaproteobacteria bacterium]